MRRGKVGRGEDCGSMLSVVGRTGIGLDEGKSSLLLLLDLITHQGSEEKEWSVSLERDAIASAQG